MASNVNKALQRHQRESNMNKRISTVFAILMIALTLVGVSYACWNKTLTINGYVKTGKLDAKITKWFCDDPKNTIDPGYTKDVGWTNCTIDPNDPQIAYLEIHNGYPSYSVHYSITINNTGNVAWIVNGYKIDDTPIPENQWFPVDIDGDGYNDVEFYITDSIGEQRDPGFAIETSLDTHIMQDAHKDFTYALFTLTFELVQWNEYPYIP